jgi:hypothetical protein
MVFLTFVVSMRSCQRRFSSDEEIPLAYRQALDQLYTTYNIQLRHQTSLIHRQTCLTDAHASHDHDTPPLLTTAVSIHLTSNSSLPPSTTMLQRISQKNAANAARIAEASLKASEAFIDRTKYTLNYRKKRDLAKQEKQDYEDKALLRRRGIIYTRTLRQMEKDAMKASREDWELGPLAPKRDVGDLKDKYGSVAPDAISPPELSPADIDMEKKRIGSNRYFIHDRVVVLTGRDQGKIGEVTNVDMENLTVTVRGLGAVCCHFHDEDIHTSGGGLQMRIGRLPATEMDARSPRRQSKIRPPDYENPNAQYPPRRRPPKQG